MAWFPIFLDLKDQRCLVVGGGKTALRKADCLVQAQADVTVIAPKMDAELERLPVCRVRRPVCPADLEGAVLVVDAAGDPATTRLLARLCREQHCFLDAASDPGQGNAQFPAVLRRGDLVAGISTSGASPAAAAWVRDRLDSLLPRRMEEILQQMRALRAQAKARISQQQCRAEFLHRCLNAALQKERPLTDEELRENWSMANHDK